MTVLLQSASAGRRLGITRSTADRLVAGLVKRAQEIDANPAYLFGISRMAVFGSYLTEKVRLGDIDIAVEFGPKCRDRELHNQKCEEQFNSEKPARRVDLIAELFWSERKTNKALRQGHTSFSFHEYRELVEMKEAGLATSREIY